MTMQRLRSRNRHRHRGIGRGHAMTESLLIISFAALTLAAIPAIGEYGTKRMQTVAAAKLLAWQRTVWMPEAKGIDDSDAKGAAGAIKKTDAEVTRDLRRHIFRDRKTDGATIHAPEIAEFETAVPGIDPRTTKVTASSTAATLPSLMNATDYLADSVRVAQTALSSNVITQSLGKFTFVSSGYMRHQVDVTQTDTLFAPLPEITMSEQVTMLTEAWNAGGTMREEKKIWGLVPMKMADAPFYQQMRTGLHQTAYQINQIFPTFSNANLTFGLEPGDAKERSPLDRFELIPPTAAGGEAGGGGDAVGASTKDKFRYYRSFPPPPVVNTLP